MERWRRVRGYAWALASTAAATLAGLAMEPRFALVNIAMVFMLGVALVALRQSRGPAVLSALASVIALDWLFVPPTGAFTVDDVQYVFTFGAMLVIALVISRLTEDARRQARSQAEL